MDWLKTVEAFLTSLGAPGWKMPRWLFQATVAPIVGATALVDGATIAIDAVANGSFMGFAAASNAVREFELPTNMLPGLTLTIRLKNTSGGALTNTTFAAGYKQPAFTWPATGFNRLYAIVADETGTVISVIESGADIPN